jgi:diguanylate cyclase (GGDEF)-like protein
VIDSENATPLTPVQGGVLQLAQALHLLQREGLHLPTDLETGSQPWLQALVDALCTLSSSDPLTGLVNRRQFEAALDGEVDRVARSSETALLLLADIDHFKRVNDTYGHGAGDLVIQAVARALLECVRPMDTVARIGGEEFAIVLPNCPPAFARTVAERIRRRIETLAVPVSTAQALNVSISIGGAFAPQWVRSSRQFWYERADQQLYRAKTGGRNQACLESPAVSEVSTEERELLFSVPPALAPDESQASS